MKSTLSRTQLSFCAAFILSYFVAYAYSRWNAGSLPPQAAGAPVEETRARPAAAAPAERVFVVAKRAPDVALPGDSTILVCEREAAGNAVRMLEQRGYSSLRIVPGAAAVAAESHGRHRSERLADGCTEWRPFAL